MTERDIHDKQDELAESDDIVTSIDQIRDVVGEPLPPMLDKVIDHIDDVCRSFIEKSPFAVIASVDSHGLPDLSPKGDPCGFVQVLDEKHLAIPDRPGNRRADTFQNLLANPQVAIIFLIPGKGETLRVRGKASIVRDEALRAGMAVKNRVPEFAVVVQVEQNSTNCKEKNMRITLYIAALLVGSSVMAQEADESMSFFLTSAGPGNGANLGGLEGADARCQSLADSVGAGGRTWQAYLSTTDVDARDRIGNGPWYNSRGVEIASSVDNLHGDNNMTKETQLSENGEVVNGRGDSPNRHDILTGSNADGTASDATCDNWASGGDGSARVGHHDRTGGGDDPTSWNSAHESRGCSQSDLQGTGGDGLFYCFAID